MKNQIPPSGILPWLLVMAGLVLAVPPVSAQPEPLDDPCPATTLEDRLPSIIAPMAGQHPVWLVDGSFGTWQGSEALVKTLWVLAREVRGDLVLHGRQRDGSGVLRFQSGVDASPTEELVLSDAQARSLIPGGASPDVMQRFVFVSTAVLYPRAGCWEITARLGDDEVQIVVEVRAEREKGR